MRSVSPQTSRSRRCTTDTRLQEPHKQSQALSGDTIAKRVEHFTSWEVLKYTTRTSADTKGLEYTHFYVSVIVDRPSHTVISISPQDLHPSHDGETLSKVLSISIQHCDYTLQPTFALLVGTLSTNKFLELTGLPRASTGDSRTGRRAEKPPVRSNEDFHFSLV
jgi:hypothetical protein